MNDSIHDIKHFIYKLSSKSDIGLITSQFKCKKHPNNNNPLRFIICVCVSSFLFKYSNAIL